MDKLLLQRGFFSSRSRALEAIKQGSVRVDQQIITKPGCRITPTAQIALDGAVNPFVSRGGLKLQAALPAFNVTVADCVALDVGASTGGFTDCLLQCGARRVYALDVGCRQLAPKLLQDERVITIEHANARSLNSDSLPEPIDLAVIDVSFISLALVLPAVCTLVKPEGTLIALFKPQFEVGRERVGNGGIVRQSRFIIEAFKNFLESVRSLPWPAVGLFPSPLPGADGNREFFILFQRRQSPLSGDLALELRHALSSKS